MKQNSGFTLVELSIAMIIVGLIVGAVFSGRAIVANARTQALASQFIEYTAATNTFKVKYNCLPGDCRKASSLALGPSGGGGLFIGSAVAAGLGSNGDGDGLIEPNFSLAADESLYYWQHLSAAGLVKGSYDGASRIENKGYPQVATKLGMHIPATTGTRPNPNVMVVAARSSGSEGGDCLEVWCRVLMPSQAFSVDTKLDDGKPLTGKVRTNPSTDNATTPWATAVNDPKCSNAGDYRTDGDGHGCNISYNMSQ